MAITYNIPFRVHHKIIPIKLVSREVKVSFDRYLSQSLAFVVIQVQQVCIFLPVPELSPSDHYNFIVIFQGNHTMKTDRRLKFQLQLLPGLIQVLNRNFFNDVCCFSKINVAS